MPTSKAALIESYFDEEMIPKGTLLIRPGQISRRSYFLGQGIIRSFVIDLEGNEVTTRIYSSPDFLNDYLSFFKKEASKESFEALTACQVQTIDFPSVQECFHEIPEFREWGRMMLTLNYATLHNNMIAYHTETAEERYVKLVHQSPEIIQNVPLKIVASYLGITDSSLSRIRKKLAAE